MSVRFAIPLHLFIRGDNLTTTFKFDLYKDAFVVGSSGTLMNFHPGDFIEAVSQDPATFSASLSDKIVTLFYIVAPSSSVQIADIFILFPSRD